MYILIVDAFNFDFNFNCYGDGGWGDWSRPVPCDSLSLSSTVVGESGGVTTD